MDRIQQEYGCFRVAFAIVADGVQSQCQDARLGTGNHNRKWAFGHIFPRNTAATRCQVRDVDVFFVDVLNDDLNGGFSPLRDRTELDCRHVDHLRTPLGVTAASG